MSSSTTTGTECRTNSRSARSNCAPPPHGGDLPPGAARASHARSHAPHCATTIEEHRPKAHQRYLAWTPSRLVDWAATIGPATAQLFGRILQAKRPPRAGLPVVSRHFAARRAIPKRASSRGAPRRRAQRLLISKPEIDPETSPGTARSPSPRRRPNRRSITPICAAQLLRPGHSAQSAMNETRTHADTTNTRNFVLCGSKEWPRLSASRARAPTCNN